MQTGDAALLPPRPDTEEALGPVQPAGVRVPVQCNRRFGELHVAANGDVRYASGTGDEAAPHSTSVLDMCSKTASARDAELQVEADHVLGAAREGERGVRVWYCVAVKTTVGVVTQLRYKLVKMPLCQCEDAAAADLLATSVRRAASWQGKPRPPHVVVMVNPASGRATARTTLNADVLPALRDVAGLRVTVVETMGAHHATEVVRGLDVATVDMLAFMGGDGTVFEGVQGLLGRPDWEAAAKVPIAHIPCGSGNGLAASAGLWDAPTALLAIVKGNTQPLDMASVLQGPGQRWYAFLSLMYGLMSNLDIGTNHLRWMGEARFTYGGVREIMAARPYPADVLYWPGAAPAAGEEDNDAVVLTATPPPTQAAPAVSATPAAGGQVVPEHSASDKLLAAGATAGQQQHDARGLGELTPADLSTGPSLPVLSQLLPQLKTLRGAHGTAQLPGLWTRLPDKDLQLFSLCNTQYLALGARFSPQSQLCNGAWEMMWASGLTGVAGRLKGLQMLTAVEDGGHVALDFVKSATVRALLLEPVAPLGSTWVLVDGEEVPMVPTYLEVHRGLCRLVVAPGFKEHPPPPHPRR